MLARSTESFPHQVDGRCPLEAAWSAHDDDRSLKIIVTMIALIPDNLAEAHGVIAQTAEVVELVTGGFSDLDTVDAFDIILAVGGPWWHLLTGRERADALSQVTRALRPEGIFVLDGPNFEWILDHYREPQPSEADVEGTMIRRTTRHRPRRRHLDSYRQFQHSEN